MIFDKFFQRHISNKWLRLNAEALVASLIIGLVLNAFFWALSDRYSLQRVVITFGVSWVITTVNTNMIALSERLIKTEYGSKWKAPVLYYAALVLGVTIGTELVYIIFGLIFSNPIQLFGQTADLRFNLLISLVVGTIVYINGLAKVNFELRMKEREHQISRLSEMKTKAELQSLQSRINPHFLYNALNSIVSLIHESPDQAEKMTLQLSKLFRATVNAKEELFTTLKEEMEVLQLYLAIEQIRFAERLEIKIEVDEDLLNSQMPRFFMQPIVENALKHGLAKVSGKAMLYISIQKTEDKMNIEVFDNGDDFPLNMELGYGLQSTYEKLNLIYPNNYDLSLHNGSNKRIQIVIPA